FVIFQTNRFIPHILSAAAILLIASTSPASAWTRAEIDAAVRAHVDVGGLQTCASDPKAQVVRRVETQDLNADGVDDLVVYSVIYSPSRCAGMNGRQADLVISDGSGGWHAVSIARADGLKPFQRTDSAWP